MMSLFDRYLIVDWSGAGQAVKGANSLWACLVIRDGGEAQIEWVENFPTRSLFMERLSVVVDQSLATGQTLLAGFDFAFGYPAGAAEKIAGQAEWRSLWRKIASEIEDSWDNGNNRFDVASRWNRDHFASKPRFWGRPHQHSYSHLSDTKPPAPLEPPLSFRISERYAKGAKSVWQLSYNGSVGSQSLLGIKRLSEFLDSPKYAEKVSVWPFETGFGGTFDKPIIFAEIYPSLFKIDTVPSEPRDAAQVRTVGRILADFDGRGSLVRLFERPATVSDAEVEILLREEGWVLGIGHEALGETLSPATSLDYIRDPAEIYRQSFETIRGETDLSRFQGGMEKLAIRLIHACGMTDLADDIAFSEGAFEAGAAALARGAPVLCDVEMVRHGIIRRLLPAENEVICLLNDARVRPKAAAIGNTRSAAQVDLWDEDLAGAVVAIGNAPTALLRLLERLDAGAPKPALILGFPVGFVGAAESKAALIENSCGLPFIAVRGRRGGSAMASAAVNALAGGLGAND